MIEIHGKRYFNIDHKEMEKKVNPVNDVQFLLLIPLSMHAVVHRNVSIYSHYFSNAGALLKCV